MDVIYDGGCDTCRREVQRLRSSRHRHSMRFVDARERDGFDDLLARVHGGVDAEVTEPVQAVRRPAEDSEYGWLMAVNRIPGFSHGLVLGYRLLARGKRWLGLTQPQPFILN